MIEKTCQHCGKPFMTHAAWVRNGRGKHCSHKCSRLAIRTLDFAHLRDTDMKAYAREYQRRFPQPKEQLRARDKVRNEVNYGRMPRPDSLECADCGNRARDYHHPDYEKKLDVIPLCRSCHKIRHAKKETTCQTTRNPSS